MKTIVIIIALLLFAVPVFAETYVWEDDQGTVNFADDLGKVPKKYRKKAKIVGEEEPPPQEKSEAKEPTAAGKGTPDKGEARQGAAAEEQRGKNNAAARQREEERKGEAPRENKDNAPAAQ